MSAPTNRRRRHRGRDHTLLPSLAVIVDQATAPDPGHVLVRVAGPVPSNLELGLCAIGHDSHPFDLLAGFDAPDDWAVVGMRTTGRAHHIDEGSATARRVASTFLVDRLGREASVLRFDEEVIEMEGQAQGTIPDLCRRMLGLPTAPAPSSTAFLWAAIWLDRILERWCQPERRCDLVSSWAQVAILHPAVHAPAPPDLLAVADPASLAAVARAHAAATSWRDLRCAVEPLPLPDGPLAPDIARWMDDGFFARWAIGAFPPIAEAVRELRALLGEPLGAQLLEALVLLLA